MLDDLPPRVLALLARLCFGSGAASPAGHGASAGAPAAAAAHPTGGVAANAVWEVRFEVASGRARIGSGLFRTTLASHSLSMLAVSANAVWESNVQPGWVKPTAGATREEKEVRRRRPPPFAAAPSSSSSVFRMARFPKLTVHATTTACVFLLPLSINHEKRELVETGGCV